MKRVVGFHQTIFLIALRDGRQCLWELGLAAQRWEWMGHHGKLNREKLPLLQFVTENFFLQREGFLPLLHVCRKPLTRLEVMMTSHKTTLPYTLNVP